MVNKKKGVPAMKKTLAAALALVMALCFVLPTVMAEDNKYAEHMTFQLSSTNINESVDYNGDDLAKFFEDKFNFDWDIISLPTDNADEKIRIWINAGNMPDILINGSPYLSGEMANYIDQGLLRKFPDDWKERWPNAAAAYERTSIGDAITESVGGTYVFPRPMYANSYPAEKVVPHIIAYLRKDWAEAVGFPIKDAYTTSELMEFARLVKEKDPGNVGSRLVPMAISPDYNLHLFTLPSNAYTGGTNTACEYYVDENGKHQWGPAAETTLSGLKLYKQAYDEGLLNPEFYAYTGTQAEEDFYIAGIAGMTVMQGMASYMHLVANYVEDNLGLNYDDAIQTAVILGEDGSYRTAEQINYAGYMMFNPEMSDEKFERIMDLLDYAVTDEGQMTIRMGFKGTDWDYDENGEIVSHYPEGENARSKYPSIYPVFHRLVIMSDDFTLINPAYAQKYRDRAAQMFILKNELANDTSIAPIDWNVQLHSSDAMSRVSIKWSEEYATIILSDGDIETNWQNWVKSYSYLIDPVLDELNEAYAK